MYIHENELLNSAQILKNTGEKLSWSNCILFASLMELWSSCLQELVYSVDQEYNPGLPPRYLSPGQYFSSLQSISCSHFSLKLSSMAGNQEVCSSFILWLKVHSPKVYSTKWIMHIHLSEEHVCRHLVMFVPWYTAVPLLHQTCLWEDRGCLHFVYAMHAWDTTWQGRGQRVILS